MFNVLARLLAIVALVFLSSCSQPKLAFKNIDITGADYAKDFTLVDQNGKPRTLADFKGKAVAIFFGYTQCPDVCPTALAELAKVKQGLGKDADKLQVLFITIDPARDTQAVLKAYLSNFDQAALGLRGSAEETAAVAKEFKVFYAKVPGKTANSYSMDHTAGSYVFDPEGKVRLFVRHGNDSEALISDLKLLLS